MTPPRPAPTIMTVGFNSPDIAFLVLVECKLWRCEMKKENEGMTDSEFRWGERDEREMEEREAPNNSFC